MIEADTRRAGYPLRRPRAPSLWELTRRRGYHFLALARHADHAGARDVGLSARCSTRSLLAIALSFVDRADRALAAPPARRRWPRAAKSVLAVAATTATAGIIVGVVTLTGLGLKIAGLIVAFAGGQLFLTVLYSAVAVLVLGLAVPVTASYIIAAVMVAPAMMAVGVPDVAAHMFIFYYAVLSEVSPPTALSPFAAAAITGGRPAADDDADVEVHAAGVRLSVCVHAQPAGPGAADAGAGLPMSLISAGTAALGVTALSAGLGGWMRARANAVERTLAVIGGLLLFYAGPRTDLAGVVLFGAAIALHVVRTRSATR